MAFALNDRIVQTPDPITAAVGPDLAILGLATSNYIALNPVGRRIWELLATPRSVAELCRCLEAEFEGAPEQIQADVLEFLGDLASEGLVHGDPGQPAMDMLTIEAFKGCEGGDFPILTGEGGQVPLVLTEVQARSGTHPGGLREPFALLFEGTPGLLCPQGIYRLRHPRTGGAFDLFLVPVARTAAGGIRYQAVFN